MTSKKRMVVHPIVSLGGEVQQFTQSLAFLLRDGDEGPWSEVNKYAQCASTGAVFELLQSVWRDGVRSPRPLQAGHDLLRDDEPVLHVWVPDERTVAAAAAQPIRSFFSRWETYSQDGEVFLLVSASADSIRPFLPAEPLAMTLLLYGLDEKTLL